jgi:hypothetical protein
MKELIVALDLELNQPSQRIVQIGAVLGNVRTGEVVSQFDVKVNPGEPLDSRITVLTGLSPQEIELAPGLSAAGQALAAWLSPRDSLRILNPLTWGGGDTETLREQLWGLGGTLDVRASVDRCEDALCGLVHGAGQRDLWWPGKSDD